MLLSWTDEGKYRAELLNHRNSEPVIVIRMEDNAGGEVVITVSYDGSIKVPNSGMIANAHIRISAHAPIELTKKEYREIQKAVGEARTILRKIKRRGRVLHYRNGEKTMCGMRVDKKTWTGGINNVNCKNCLARVKNTPPSETDIFFNKRQEAMQRE